MWHPKTNACQACTTISIEPAANCEHSKRRCPRRALYPCDLAGAAGGISGGYHLPFTAVALVLSQGGPHLAVLTSLATVVVAAFAGTGSAKLLDQILSLVPIRVTKTPVIADDPYRF